MFHRVDIEQHHHVTVFIRLMYNYCFKGQVGGAERRWTKVPKVANILGGSSRCRGRRCRRHWRPGGPGMGAWVPSKTPATHVRLCYKIIQAAGGGMEPHITKISSSVCLLEIFYFLMERAKRKSSLLDEYLNMMPLLYFHSLKHYLSNDT